MLKTLYNRLFLKYGSQNWWPADTCFEVCVGAILTQNTAWSNVERVIKNLRKEDLLLPEKILRSDDAVLKSLIKSAGFYNQKAERLKIFAKFILDEGGVEKLKSYSVEDVREKLLSLKGIGKETADSIILYALNKPVFVVDAYTKRLFYRYGILEIEKVDYDYVKEIVEKEMEKTEDLNEFHALIVVHCKEVCKKKPSCDNCFLKKNCRRKGA